MKTRARSLTALLVVLGVGDLVMVPFMIAANHKTAGSIPVPAIGLGAVLGVATLASLIGIAHGRRWGFVTAITGRVLDILTSVMGVVAGPALLFHVVGAITVVLSVPAIVLLVRLNPRRGLRHQPSGT
jgi:hypothetical protein